MDHNPILRFLRTAAPTGVSDAELARRYACARDEAAFELLIQRHADLVWAVCRRLLPHDHQGAEDAFQATFLALSRRCGSIRSTCCAGWLYQVALRAAMRLRTRTPVLPTVDRQGPETELPEDFKVLYEELAALAEKYRLPLLLCELEGLTHAEAAARLGWPVGTVSGYLSVARKMLRSRLTRRGVALSAFVVAGSAPAALVRSSVTFAAGGPVPPAVISLSEGVLSVMRWTKLKLLAIMFTSIAGAAALAVSQERPASAPPGTVALRVPPDLKPLAGQNPIEYAFTDIQHKDDTITPEKMGTLLRVKSSTGIGYATITPKKGAWPEQVTVLLDGFEELERFEVSVGRMIASGGRKSSGGFELALLNKEPAPMNRSDVGRLNIKVVKQKDGIAVIFPANLFIDTDAVTIHWINWLRH